ncbi:TlpA family protein disulfide reductase [Alteromonas sp. ASW11-19]|uniref:TlpA family protein disulfide reductase n=1 Tax=Alteromonas salexigens TaxID=2982530 RepID=A0ABT2VQF1_9ALTE|nr:TlpA disulfide reductase family protein [Alteromonas salexigens]MCU7554144.1 TlpA family protein disulfide reductase [Alteromonas salexigens]
MTSISIGPFALATSTALLLAAIALFYLTVHLFTRKSKHHQKAKDAVITALIAGFIVARLSFVIAFWEIYQQNLLSVLDIRDGGFSHGFGWVAGVITLLVKIRGDKALVTSYVKSGAITVALLFPLVVINTLLSSTTTYSSIEVVNRHGEPVSLPQLSDKPVVVNFWASWCPPCRREMPVLENAQAQRRDVTFVFINQKESPATARKFLQQQGVELDNVYFDISGSAAQAVGAYGLPTTLFFNPDGSLSDSHMGELSEASLQNYLDSWN